jgi:pimeloyl-ACP methyl ester carboxylesterase
MRRILFPDDGQFWYEMLRAFSYIAYGGGDFGELVVISGHIKAGDYDGWYDAYRAAADRISAEADDSLRAGHRISARDGFLRAHNYYRTADFFLHANPDDPRHQQAFKRSVECFQAAAPVLAPPAQPVKIPYENTTLPGYFYRGGDPTVPRPTLIMHTGFDGTAEEMHFSGAAAAAERGYNVLSFDGPGQGSALFSQGLVFRPDWENVVGPVIDYLLTLPGVDPQKIALCGVSMGGELAPRAAAFEPRLAAVICLDGIYDLAAPVRAMAAGITGFEQRLRADEDPELDAQLTQMAAANPTLRWEAIQAQYVFGKPSPRKAFAALLDYNLRDGIAEKITCPTLVCEGVNDSLAPGQASVLFDHLTCPKKHLVFTEEEGGDEHCQVGADRLAMGRICNWLDDTLGAPAS